MDIDNSIVKTLEDNLQQNRRLIIDELSKIFTEKYKDDLITTLNNTVIRYTVTQETIDKLLNGKGKLEDNTIKVLEYYKAKIDKEILIGYSEHTSKKSNLKEEEFKKIQEVLDKNPDKGTILKINGKYCSYPKVDIFSAEADEDYLLELITLFTVKNNPNLYIDFSNKYGEEFTDKYMYLRNITANIIAKIVARNLAKKNAYLFNQNNDFNYWMDREEFLRYAFDKDLGLILSNPTELIDKVGIDNLTKFIDQLKLIIETNSIKQKDEFKTLLDKIRSICYEKISINESLITKQLKELKEQKEKLSGLPEFNKNNPEISHLETSNTNKTLPILDLSTYEDKGKKYNKN